ncbi:hypothetical protein RvY_06150-2 [Ramazzottius varieornatus]|uniref:guanylate cyclase n=1 Tax=Ramazzottius varieornatus TaxID=947166 RepID=A0A1D1UXK2_RAMVA|nr:hypothetical protein RvY_06150-2 [Ramazzottius varieornatus]
MWHCWWLFLSWSCIVQKTQGRVFRIGYITGSRRDTVISSYDRPGYQISGAISLAVHQINQHHPDGLLQNHTLEFDYGETFGIEDVSIKHTARYALNNFSAIIGPQETCVQEARLASAFNIVMLTYFCQHAFKEQLEAAHYSTFITVKPPVAQISKAVASVLNKYNWNKITFIYNNEVESRRPTAESIRYVLEEHNIEILQTRSWNKPYYVGFEDSEEDIFQSPFDDIVKDTKDKTRIYVLVGNVDDHVGFMQAMDDAGLLDRQDYFVVGVYLNHYKQEDPAKYLRGVFEPSVSQKSFKAFKSFLGVIPTKRSEFHVEFREFNNEVNVWLQRPPFNFPWESYASNVPQKNVRVEAAYLYDAVMLYAQALDACLRNPTDCPDPHDGNKLARYIKGQPYKSAMGYGGYIDAKGDAQGNYSLLALKTKRSGGPDWDIGLVDIGIFLLSANDSELPTLELREEIQWPAGHPPLDEPDCGFDGKKCVELLDNPASVWIYIVAASVATIALIALCLGVRRYVYEQKLMGSLWRIDYKDLHIEELKAHLKKASLLHAHHDAGNLDHHASVDSLTFVAADIGHISYARMMTDHSTMELGLLKKKQIVTVKKVRKRHLDLTREVRKELLAMREIRHDNLCEFVGACTDPVCIVMAYCQRGSLKDVLYDENLALDDLFLASLIGDCVKGMYYIHYNSSLKSHGNLKPSNCLIDSRFVLKITDYGLHEFKRKNESSTHRIQEQNYERMLWTAPELLRMDRPPPGGTPSGDVYSFGFILFEIYGRCGPFGDTTMSSKDIITQLRIGSTFMPFRPSLHCLDHNTPEYVISLILDAWKENPQQRPDFIAITSRLKPMQKGMKSNFVDNILALLQRHANNLESLVSERTLQLQEEKKKTELLLYEILPRPVAEHLIKHERVEAEQFESVTIFFSDIVGFTALSAESTPLEVVALLNDLYTLFDSLLEHYDAYKVETIGDSYMVCSGLPVTNGNRHAGVIASMSLQLLDSTNSFRIRHRPEKQLLLRIGIHSGPVVAGVVSPCKERYVAFSVPK